jgi:hypothetical protein
LQQTLSSAGEKRRTGHGALGATNRPRCPAERETGREGPTRKRSDRSKLVWPQAVAGGANVPAQATRRSQRRAAWDVAIRLAPRCSFMAEIRMPARHQLRIIPPNVTVQWPASRPRSGPSANVLAKGDIPVGFIFLFFSFLSLSPIFFIQI